MISCYFVTQREKKCGVCEKVFVLLHACILKANRKSLKKKRKSRHTHEIREKCRWHIYLFTISVSACDVIPIPLVGKTSSRMIFLFYFEESDNNMYTYTTMIIINNCLICLNV